VLVPLPDDVPPAGAVPLTVCVLGSLLVVAVVPLSDVVDVPLTVTPLVPESLVPTVPSVPELPVVPVSVWVEVVTVLSTVPVSAVPTVAVTTSCDWSGGASALADALDVVSVENQPMPPDAVPVVAGVVVAAGVGVVGATGVVGAAAGAGAGVAAVVADVFSATGVPMLSVT
jgi:hypothetical protein